MKMISRALLAALLILGISGTAAAQDKVAYASLDYILSLIPEAKVMNQELETMEKMLSKKLQVQQEYAQSKLQDYQELLASKAPEAQVKTLEAELMKLDNEIKEAAGKAEQQLLNKRQSLMEPIAKRLEDAIKKVATTEGYTFVLNSTDGSASSIILHGPEESDLTDKILAELGITPPPASASGKGE